MLFQTCMKLVLLFNIKEYILKTSGNQTVAGSHWLYNEETHKGLEQFEDE